MKAINTDYVRIEKIEEEKGDGFVAVEVQDNFVYKGKVKALPLRPVYVDSYLLEKDDIVIFAKYSPDTHEIDGDKFVKVTDILEVI